MGSGVLTEPPAYLGEEGWDPAGAGGVTLGAEWWEIRAACTLSTRLFLCPMGKGDGSGGRGGGGSTWRGRGCRLPTPSPICRTRFHPSGVCRSGGGGVLPPVETGWLAACSRKHLWALGADLRTGVEAAEPKLLCHCGVALLPG